MDDARAWWQLLCGIAGLNLLAWIASGLWLQRQRSACWPQQRLQLLLSAVYVLGCGYRSLLPVYDVPRIVMVDSFASSVLVGRSVATVAELAFAGQWALLLHATGRATGHAPSRRLAWALLPMIALAELCSWHAVLSARNLGHVLEETLWGSAAVLTLLALRGQWPRADARMRRWLLLAMGAAGLYAAYMFCIDVPMYAQRWRAEEAAGRPFTSLAEGLRDAASRWTVSHDWAHWRSEVLWMTLYFSVAVWISIGLSHVRLPGRAS